ncbi:hypothetical protein [Pyxidicoccus sp. MSG2]|uniref:hypothetical protein n=1 Tax=Pyxidicoccus sp. MSG2 TaxID=2996790 RepID=UPI00227213F1|nr:hypothetical protein [Pyxidicoccus sp. MSG2]MCY1016213.1 hypothetical protein [Pyxidicoccus sp. MSG2]
MPFWRLLLMALFLCLTGTGCSAAELPTARVAGALVAGDTSESDTGGNTDPDVFNAGRDTGEEPTDSVPDGDPFETEGEADSEAPGPNAVRVTSYRRDLSTEDEEEQPWNFPPGALELFVLEGDSFVPIPGAPGAPGEYVFPYVPPGVYYLKDGNNVLVTGAREVDLGFNQPLRDDIVDLDFESSLRVSLGNLEPWHDRFSGLEGRQVPPFSDLQLVSEQLGFGTSLVLYDMFEGATAAVEELQPARVPMFEAERGDRARVVQQSPRELCALPGGGVQRYLTAVRALHLPPFSHDGTLTLDLEGRLVPLPLRELPLDWRLSAFTSLAADVHPEAVPATSRFSMRPASAEPSTEGWMGFPGELMSLGVPHDGPDDLAGTVVYGNPSQTHPGAVARAATTFAVPVRTPDGMTLTLTASTFVQDRPARLAGGPLLPRIQPPRQLTIDGTEAYSSRTLEAGAHVIGWEQPSDGAPDVYLLRLQRLDLDDPGSPFPIPTLQLYVDGGATSVRLPPGVLQPGSHYSLTVESVVSEGYAVGKRPLMLNDRFSISRAAALCGLLSVPESTA